jgi:hypothetical protein
VGVLAEADDLLRRMRTGKLTVTSQPDKACSVYLNGRHLGTTPFVLDRAASGEYRVQVECAPSKAGRVHTVQLGDEPVSMTVDTAFDRAVFSDPRLWLGYDTERSARKAALEHAVAIGREVRAEDVVLVRVQGDVAELTRVRVQQARLAGRARASWNGSAFERASLTKAVAALSEGRIEAEPLGELEPEPELAVEQRHTGDGRIKRGVEDVRKPPAPTTEELVPRWRKRTGYALTGVSLAVFATGLGLELWSQELKDDLVVTDLDTTPIPGKQDQYDRVSAASWLGVAAGPLGLLATLAWVAPRAEVPWWSWGLGVLGLGAAGVGIYQVAIADNCTLHLEERGCLRTEHSAARGAMLVSAALPLISVPVLHLVRRTKAGPTASVTGTSLPGGGVLRLVGRF